jgi:uncharacterized protein (DUF2147 family)
MFKRTISRAAKCGLVLLAVGLGVAMASTNESDSPLGLWTTASGHGVIAIDTCGDALCGQIVGIDRAPTEPMPTDVHGQPQCGLTIITNERPDGSGTWVGNVTDPRDGSTYGAKIWLEQGDLHLRGYIGIPLLGSTQVWHPFAGRLTADCGMA